MYMYIPYRREERLNSMMQKIKRNEAPAGRPIFESSDSTDDVENSFCQLHTPIPHTLPHPHKVALFGTQNTPRKKSHVRRKRRSEGDTHPISPLSGSHEIPVGKFTPLVTPHQLHSGQYLYQDCPPSGKVAHMNLGLKVGNHNTQEGEKSDHSIEPPITPGGSLSPAVDELIKSLQKVPSRTHRRTGSGESITSLRTARQTTTSKQTTSEISVRKMSSAQLGGHSGSLEMLSGYRDSAKMRNGILYSNLDSSDSDSGPESFQDQDKSKYPTYVPIKEFQDGEISHLPSAQEPGSTPSTAKMVGTNWHDADSESNYAETESTAEEHLAETTDTLSLSLSPTPTSTSPHPPSSTTASDHHNSPPSSPIPSCSSQDDPTETPTINTPRDVTPAFEDVASTNDKQTRTVSDEEEGTTTSTSKVSMLISQFEVGGSDKTSDDDFSSNSPPDSPKLEIPLHIRRDGQPQSYSTARAEQSSLHENILGNSTSIVRHFFENIVSKGLPENGMQRRSYSTPELEDSGFQVGT